jgi:hypothetical protein
MKEEVEGLLKALGRSGCQGAEAFMPALVAAIRSPIDPGLTRTVLDALRSQRCFALMKAFAEQAAKAADGGLLVYVKRQLAQSQIELGSLDDAIALLEGLTQDVARGGSSRDRSEVTGLLGRALKQRFVQAVKAGGEGEDELRAAVGSYIEVYALDPSWHGANIVALAARAERDGLAVGIESAETWARRLLGDLLDKGRPAWSPWDYAAAGEAYLALGDRDQVADCFAHYWSMANADAFALGGTRRQLQEIWQISSESDDEFLSSLLLHLEARRLCASRGSACYTATDLVKIAARLGEASGRAEATFGAGSAIPLRKLLDLIGRAKSVCRITDPYQPSKGGSGFLVKGSDLGSNLDGVFVLTNHHVLYGEEATDDLLAGDDYRGATDVQRAEAEFSFWGGEAKAKTVKLEKVVRHSPRREADFALASIREDVPSDYALRPSHAPKPLGSRNVVDPRQKAKVFVVGHPGGNTLSFSVSDNEVVDHELDDDPCDHPRLIHYRAPTEPGSSGSPVFHGETLDVIGLHRSGRVGPLRDDWPRAKQDEIYEANEAVSMRALLEQLK